MPSHQRWQVPGDVLGYVLNPKLHYVDELEYVVHLLFIELYLFLTSVGLVVTSAAAIYAFVTVDVQRVILSVYVGSVGSPLLSGLFPGGFLARSFLWMCLQSAATGCYTATPPTQTSTSAIARRWCGRNRNSRWRRVRMPCIKRWWRLLLATHISDKVRLVSPATPSRAASRSSTSAVASRGADCYESHAGEMQGST